MPPLLSDLLEDSGDLLAAIDPDGRVLRCSRVLRVALGWPESQVCPGDLMAVTPPDAEARARSLLARVGAGEREVRGTWTLQLADGRREDWSARLRPAGDGQAIWVLFQSQTARLHARLAGLFDTSPQVGLIAVDTGGRIVRFNRGAERIYGLAAADVLGRPYHEVLTADSELAAARTRALEQEFGREIGPLDLYTIRARTYGSEEWSTRIPRPDGTFSYIESVISPVRDDGEIVGFVGILRDVTAAHAAQEAHDRLDQRLRAALLGSLDSIILTDAICDASGRLVDLVIVEVNPGALNLLRTARETLIGKRLREIARPDRVDSLIAKYNRVLATGETLDEEMW
ncbi:MAG TPA: PAS domain-containing protein, partial [Nannocystis sp.]